MPLSLDTRRVGDLTVITCSGRLVEGAESSALQRRLLAMIFAKKGATLTTPVTGRGA